MKNEDSVIKVTDIIGTTLSEARILLNKIDITIEAVKVTAPPKEKSEEFNELYRVIRFKEIENRKLELLVCKPLS